MRIHGGRGEISLGPHFALWSKAMETVVNRDIESAGLATAGRLRIKMLWNMLFPYRVATRINEKDQHGNNVDERNFATARG